MKYREGVRTLSVQGWRNLHARAASVEALGDPDELSLQELKLRNERAHTYDAEYAAAHGPFFPNVEVSVIRRTLRPSPDEVLLELGCGTGRLTIRLAPHFREVVAMDRSRASLNVLRERLRRLEIENVTVVEADVTDRLSVGRLVDKVLAVQLLQHIPTQDRRRIVLESVLASLRPAGRIVLVDENHGLVRKLRSKPREIATVGSLFFHPFDSKEVLADLESVGFEAVQIGGCGVLYWVRYRFASRSLAIIDPALAFLPGATKIARFLVSVGRKPRAERRR